MKRLTTVLKTIPMVKRFIFILPLVVVVLFYLYILTSCFTIFPGNKTNWYSDKEKGGSSRVHSLDTTGGILKYSYSMGNDVLFPYLAVFIQPGKGDNYFDFSGSDFLTADITAVKSRRIAVLLNSEVRNYSRPEDPNSYRPLIAEFDYDPGQSTFQIPMSSFTTPSWWFSNRKITEKETGAPDFSRITSVCIQNCQQLPAGETEYITVRSLVAGKSLYWPLYYLLPFLIVYYGAGFLLVRKSKKAENSTFPNRRKLEVGNIAEEEFNKLLTFMGENYSEPELNLEKIQKDTGLSESKVNSIFKNQLQTTFKKYLNQLRIEEAKRLLKETDRPVMDIAFRTGYSNVTHFNRVFKEQEGNSPNEYRKSTLTGTLE